MKKLVFISLILIGVVVFSAAQTASNDPIRQEGIASWYGKEFQNRPTASGELFNMAEFTAAHPTLPFGTMVTVTNKQNNRRVTVRVNDRGPFVAARIIDLSRAAAEALDMIGTGTAPVIVESAVSASLGPVSPAAAAAPAPPAETPIPPVVVQAQPVETPTPPVSVQTPPVQPAPAVAAAPPAAPSAATVSYTAPPAVIKGVIPPSGSTRLYRIQVGAFSVPRNALDVFERLKAAGLNPRYEQYGNLYRVVLAELKAADIPAIAQKLGNSGFQEVLLREES